MPVTKTATISYSLTQITVDMIGGFVQSHFTRSIDGEPSGSVEMLTVGDDMLALLGTQAVAGQPLGSEITDAVYNLAISKGLIEGVIS